jgi:hypothetical protein
VHVNPSVWIICGWKKRRRNEEKLEIGDANTMNVVEKEIGIN